MVDTQAGAAPVGHDAQPEQDRPLDPEKLLRLAGLVKGVLEEVRQMDPDQPTSQELAGLYERVLAQVAEGLPGMLRQELDAMDLGVPLRDGATGQEVRIAYAGLIGWLSGMFQGLQAAMQYQQLQGQLALQQGVMPGQVASPDPAPALNEHGTGQYL